MSVLSDWKASLVTQEVFAELAARIDGLKAELATSAGINPREDAIRVGAIQAYQDILDIELETEESE